MRKFAVRRLSKNGNSFTVALPREFCLALGLRRRAELHVILDDETKVLTIEPAPRRADDVPEIKPAHVVRPMLT